VTNFLGVLPIKFSLLSELRRRHVVKNALLYVVTSWLLLQAGDLLFPALQVEAWAFPLLLSLLLLFFVPALIFSWVYEMTPAGLKLEKDVEHDSPEMISSGIKINKVIAVLLVIAIGVVVVDRLVPETVVFDLGRGGAADPARVGLAAVPPVADEMPLPTDRSIAVLSFMDLSNGPGAESLGDGIAEQVLNLLAKKDELQVTSRSSAFAYKGQRANMRQMRQALNVANILEGSVHYFDGHVRITAELIDTKSDRVLWSETYDRSMIDVLVVQQEIAAEIARAVAAALLTGGPQAKVSSTT
jgi:TolB-like protein